MTLRSLQRLGRACQNSVRGLSHALQTERAIQQEAVTLAVMTPVASMIAQDAWSWISLIGVILLLIVIELVNTAIELLCDFVEPEHHPTIGHIKDLGSAAVLCALVLAAAVWLITLWHALWRLGV